MSTENDPNQLVQLWKWAMGAIGLGAAWLWNNTMGRIAALEKNKVEKQEYNDYILRAETSRIEQRDATNSLFVGQERISQSLARIEGVLSQQRRKND